MAHDVHVHYFAAARDLAGCSSERVALPASGVSLAELRQLLGALHPQLAPFLPRMRLAINDELHVQDEHVSAGDEVSVLPPVAGGSNSPVHCVLQETALSVDAAIAQVSHPGAGGIAIFLGVVRDHAAQGSVSRLDYEAHESLAVREMTRILNALSEQYPGTRISVQHRVGQLAIGDAAVVVAASAPHRAEAFAVCRAAIDEIKKTVPIWKKEWAPDGTALWVNLDPSVAESREKKT
ncbi:MAG TPA: molybdenum cofactor biosynthesis protein MoaE [Polyangiales bacterium]|nr:molybdenum cofactor biosynthesis protein MoaE [Polyangiales bacterium]